MAKKKNTKKFDSVVICVVVLCLIIVVGAICFCLTYKNENNKKDETTTTSTIISNIDPIYEDGDYLIYEIPVDSKTYTLKTGTTIMLDGYDDSYYIDINGEVVASDKGTDNLTVYVLGQNLIFSKADGSYKNYLFCYTSYRSFDIYSNNDTGDKDLVLSNYEVTKDGINLTYSRINGNYVSYGYTDSSEENAKLYSLCNDEYKSLAADLVVEKKYFIEYADGELSGFEEKSEVSLTDYLTNNTVCE